MKQILCLSLSLLLLSACQSQSEPSPNTPSQEVPSSQEATQEPSQEQSQEDSSPLAQEDSLSQLYHQAISQARSPESNEENPILSSTEDEFSEIIFPMFQFSPQTAEGFAISMSSMMVQAYGIAVISPVEGQEEAVKEGLQFFIDTQLQNFQSYLPDQLSIAQEARLETLEDGTILLVMCPDQDQVFQSIADYLEAES